MNSKHVLALMGCTVLFFVTANAQCITGAATAGSVFYNNTNSGVGTSSWTNTQNAQASDNVYATASVTVGVLATVNTRYLTATGFGFVIPPAATICGVTVSVQRIREDLLLGAIVDNSVKLLTGGNIGGTEHASGADWSTTKQTVSYGGAADMWGLALTPLIVNATNFGVGISAKLTGGPLIALLLEGGIDYISMAITYQNGSSLPITVVRFSAVGQNNTDVLNWTATDNDAGDQFIVQRSGDSQNWQDLATMPAVADTQQYTYTDYAPLNGNNFYRLYLENKGVQGQYSTIVEVSQENGGITCYPNPVVSVINISSPKPIQHVVLRDLQGRTIQAMTVISGNNTLQLPAGSLPPGMYLLQVDGVLFKLMKQ
jgi:Secretion system C-terminal sorting domain